MANKQQRDRMKEYIMEKWDSEGKPRLYMEGDVNGVIVPDQGVIFLIDKPITDSDFREFYSRARTLTHNFSFLFYKDGKNYFRSAVAGQEDTGIRSKHSKSIFEDGTLRKYEGRMQNIISTTPAEMYAYNVSRSRMDSPRWVQYYQPASENLEEAIESFHFNPVEFDYTLKDRQGLPPTETSKKLLIWDRRNHNSRNFKLVNGVLAPSSNDDVVREK